MIINYLRLQNYRGYTNSTIHCLRYFPERKNIELPYFKYCLIISKVLFLQVEKNIKTDSEQKTALWKTDLQDLKLQTKCATW